MLRIHFIQHWFNLADLSCEEALYGSASLRRFAGIDLGRESIPDATTLLKFRKLLNEHKLGEALFAKVGHELQARGLKVSTGTIVDATIIGATSSIKNAAKARDPEIHQTRKGKQWYFGMKLHIGVDLQTGLAHSAVVTAANVHDKHPLPHLLHGNEQRVYGDSAYASQKALIHSKAAKAKGFTNQLTKRNGEIDEVARAKNRSKSSIRARVEHVFGVVKRLWGFGKVRYRGLAKNATRAFTSLGLANIFLARKTLTAQVRPCGCKAGEQARQCGSQSRKSGPNWAEIFNRCAIPKSAVSKTGLIQRNPKPLLDRVSGQSGSPAYLSVRELVAQLHAPHLTNHVHGDHLLHPC